jgi:hypothetical protein
VQFSFLGRRRAGLKAVLLPQHLLLVAGVILYVFGMAY